MSERFTLRVSTSEVAGPSGRGSRAELDAKVPRPDSGVRLVCPHTLGGPDGLACELPANHAHGHVFTATHGADLSGEVGSDDE